MDCFVVQWECLVGSGVATPSPPRHYVQGTCTSKFLVSHPTPIHLSLHNPCSMMSRRRTSGRDR